MNKSKLSTLFRILKDYMKAHPVAVIIALICIFLNCVGAITAPLLLQKVIDLAVSNKPFDEIATQYYTYLGILIGAYVIAFAGGITYSQLSAKYAQVYMHELRCRLFEHMEDLPISYFDKHDKGLIMSTYTNDIDTIRQLLAESFSSIAICSITFISIFFVMLSSSFIMTGIVIIGTLFMLLNLHITGGKSAKNFIVQQQEIANVEGYIEEMMNGLKVVKSFTHEQDAIKDLSEKLDTLQSVSYKANKYANILMPIMGNIGNFLYVIVAFVGVCLYVFKLSDFSFSGVTTTSIGIVISFLPMVRQFTNNVSEASNQFNPIAMAIGGGSRIYQMIDEPVEVDNGYVSLVKVKENEQGELIETTDNSGLYAWKHPHKETNDITYTLLKGDIRLFDVDFGYNPSKIVLHDVSLYAKPGQKIAFVGATGAGKTTITNLINRFYDIADGKIRYDGININKIKKKDLRRSLAMVLQDTNLFSGTIMDNIRFGRLDATDEECIQAAKLANADSFITRLPEGYNTYIKGNGSSLSQGQAQLLSIARAAVSNCPVLILDEATSSIDTRTEAIVLKGMENLMKGKTVFLIAHRLSTIKDAQAIMVLEKGKIIERGTHEQLIAMKGYYYQLYTGAFELE